MSEPIEHGQSKKFDLELGKATVVRLNRPAKFRIEFINGSYVEGVIPANQGLKVCNFGDITGFDIVIDEESMAGLSVVDGQ